MNFKLELTVGAFIALGLASVLVLAFASTNSADRLGGETYLVTARFANSGELKARAPVKIAGVKVGEVAELRLDPDKFEAVATLRLSHAAGALPADTSAAIYTAGLLGERYIGLSPGGDPETLADGDELYLTQSAVVLEQLIGKYLFSGPSGNSGDDAGHKADDGGVVPPSADGDVPPATQNDD